MRFLSFTIILLLSSFAVKAQITGNQSVFVGDQVNYTYNGLAIIPEWQVTNGTIVSSSSSGTVHSALIQWDVVGSGSVRFLDNGGLLSNLAVTVSNPLPQAPTPVNGNRCGNGTVTLSATPGASGNNIRWYTTVTRGTYLGQSLSYTTPSLTSTTTYYITTVNTTTGAESSPRVAITATISPVVSNATSLVNATRCGAGVATISATVGANGNTLRWYAASTGGSPLATGLTYQPNVTTTTSYFVSSFNTGTGCESARLSVTVTVNALPANPTVTTPPARCGTGNVTLQATPITGTIRWYNQASGGSVIATGNTYTPSVSSTSTFYASAFNSTTTCESARVPVVAAINPLPQLPVSTQAYYGRFGFGTLTFSIQPITDPSTSIQWLTQSDVVIANENKPIYTTDFSSTSVVKVKTIHTNGCQSNSLSLTANVLAPPSIQITGNTYLANGQSVTLSLPSTYPNFQWKRDGVNLVGSTSNSISVSQPGRYTCSITLSNGVTDESEHIYVTTLTNEPVAIPAPTYASDAPALVTNAERKNYIRKYIAKKPALTPADFVFNNPDMTEIGIETQYLDGLGMPIQKVQKNASPSGKDIIVPAVYDQWAREAKVFLPYTSNSTDIDVDGFRKNAILEQFNFYRNAPAEIAKTGVAFSETEFEASPLNRIVKKSSPGETFKLGSGREVKSNTWSLSSEDLPVRIFTVSEAGALLQTGNFYTMRDLLVSEITDQNNERAREYKDKEGRVILKRVKSDGNEWLDTYYVYDGIGNLAYVLPPLLHKRSFPYATASVDSIAFQYRYDARQRLIEKRVPGSGWTYIIYDALDRVVLVQNPAQRTSNRWLFTKYDAFDRPIMTGETVNATSYATLRSTISQQAGFETKDSNNNYTLNNSTPAVLSAEVHTQTFYDNYQLPTPFQINTTHLYVRDSTLTEGTGHPNSYFKRVKGQVTATLVRNLDTQAWLETINYYNDRQQIIQTISRNNRNGMDRVSIAYENTLSKNILKTITRHNVGAPELIVVERIDYDNEDRLISKYHKTGSMAEIRTANLVYNEIGQLVEKNLHSTTGQRWMQSEDYRYAISGALKSINELSTGVSDANDLFSMELFFEEGYALKQFNGNITGMRWRSARTGQEQSYGYVYDPLNRLRVAEYKRKDGAANTWTLDLDRYKEVVTGYDANGNIRGIQRNGQLANQAFGQIDNLVYSYNGNTLLKVRDMAGDAAGFKDDGTTTSDPVNDYQYDANGSLVKDDNKQIQTIEYNYFNLPRRVVKSNNEYIKYIYNALGQKMRQEVYSSTNVLQKATDYCGNFVYENNNLQFFSHADGRVVNKGSGQWQYQYFAKDHLGNNRITYASEFTTYTADMETATNPAFTNYTRTEQDLFDHTDAGTVYKFAHRLTGASNSQVGLAKSLQVQAGDTVKVEVWAKYFGTTSGSSGLSTFANSLLTAFGLQAPVAGESGTPAAALNGYGNFVAGGGYSGTNTGPRGFLNILFFDKNYVLKDVAFQKLDESYVQPVGSLVKQPHQKLQRQIVADEPGFVYIYVSNEGYQIQDIYFDDMVIKHSYTQVQQEENYYPFGLSFNSYNRNNSVLNQYKFNGKEEQDELDLDWHDFGARMYDNIIGRFLTVDPKSNHYWSQSVYVYAANNPIVFIDENGEAPVLPDALTLFGLGNKMSFNSVGYRQVRDSFRPFQASFNEGKSNISVAQTRFTSSFSHPTWLNEASKFVTQGVADVRRIDMVTSLENSASAKFDGDYVTVTQTITQTKVELTGDGKIKSITESKTEYVTTYDTYEEDGKTYLGISRGTTVNKFKPVKLSANELKKDFAKYVQKASLFNVKGEQRTIDAFKNANVDPSSDALERGFEFTKSSEQTTNKVGNQ